MSKTGDTYAAREHARAQAGTRVDSMPTIPVREATNLPAGVDVEDLLWDETFGPGAYGSRILPRGARLRLVNLDGDASVSFMVHNHDHPIERLNIADTVKVQWQAYPEQGALLLSDMGRVMMSLEEDTCGKHDTFCGCSTEKSNAAKYGRGENYSEFPNARDRLLLALAKHGLGKLDLPANINLFKGVRIESDGAVTFIEDSAKAGDQVTLRAEMNVLVTLANTPHVLDPRDRYTVTPVRALAWRGPVTPEDDPIRNSSPERLRAFQNTEDYWLQQTHE